MFSEGRLHKWDGKTGAETVFGREDFFGYFGMVVDPNNHDVYALNATSKRMEKYFPSGKKGAPTFFATEANGNPALGPEGHFFIPKSPGKFENTILPGGEGEIVEYSHGGELLDTVDCSACPGVPTLNGPVAVALDQDGDLFVADWENHRVIKFMNVAGELVSPTVFSTGPSSAVAVDRSTGRVFVGGRESEEDDFEVTVYDELGNELQKFGAGMFGDGLEILGGGDQITVDQGTGHVFVGDAKRVRPAAGNLLRIARSAPVGVRRAAAADGRNRTGDGRSVASCDAERDRGPGREPRPELQVRIRADRRVRRIRALRARSGVRERSGLGQRRRLGPAAQHRLSLPGRRHQRRRDDERR